MPLINNEDNLYDGLGETDILVPPTLENSNGKIKLTTKTTKKRDLSFFNAFIGKFVNKKLVEENKGILNSLQKGDSENSFYNLYEKITNKVSFSYIILFCLIVYNVFFLYNSVFKDNIFFKLKSLPGQVETMKILDINISSQKEELETLDNLQIEDSELSTKQNYINDYIPYENESLEVNQIAKLINIIEEEGVNITTFKKTYPERNEDTVSELGKELSSKGLDINFYEDVWFIDFTIDFTANEDQLMLIIEKIDKRPELLNNGFTPTFSSDGLYSISLGVKSFYIINNL